MKKIYFLLLSALISHAGFAQSINGQWRGFFNEGTNNISLTGGTTEYVLELDIKGDVVSGTSYTYFENRRYFVLCNLNGTYNKKTKKIVVNETERVKGATPPDWSDCLQTHILYYEKQDGKEVLTGDWKTSPYNASKGGCGWGATTLSRRISTNTFSFNKQNRTPAPKTPVAKNTTPPKNSTKRVIPPPVVKTPPAIIKQAPPVVKAPAKTIKPAPPVVKNDNPVKKELVKADPPVAVAEKKIEAATPVTADRAFEKRSADVLKQSK